MDMATPESNVVPLAPRRLDVRMVPLLDADYRLQMAILAWLELAEAQACDHLSNPAVCGRLAFVFDADGTRLMNERFLRARFPRPDQTIGLGRGLMQVVGPVDRPRALHYASAPDGDSGQFAVLPVTVDGRQLNVLRLARW